MHAFRRNNQLRAGNEDLNDGYYRSGLVVHFSIRLGLNLRILAVDDVVTMLALGGATAVVSVNATVRIVRRAIACDKGPGVGKRQ
jgi:hypothetical protein